MIFWSPAVQRIWTTCPMCLDHLPSVSLFLIGDDARTVHNIYHPPVRTTHLLISAGPRKRSLPQHPTQQVYCGKNASRFTITVANSVSIAVDSVFGADRGLMNWWYFKSIIVAKYCPPFKNWLFLNSRNVIFLMFSLAAIFLGRILNSSLDGGFIKCVTWHFKKWRNVIFK